jgi:carboxymethylenebutenolidase
MLIQSEVVDLATPTGTMRCYVHRPTHNKPAPAILFYSEIFQQTGPIERAAIFMAGHGYAVIVPEVFHELNPIGTVLGYDDAGREKGNADKSAKDAQGYDTDNQAMIQYLATQDWYNGNVGAMGYCIGGHLAFRAALQPEVKATACFYATDLHLNTIPNKPKQHSMERLADINGELMMIWGKQDTHIPTEGRRLVLDKLTDTDIKFSWHELNAQHGFMRDGDPRNDPQLVAICYQMALQMFGNAL